MEDTAYIQPVHHNVAETMREIARRSGGVVVERQGVLLYAAGPSSPALWNGTIRIDPTLGAEEIRTMADEFFSKLGRGYTFHTFDQLDQDLDEALQRAGYKPQVAAPQMILQTSLAESELPDGVMVKIVADDQRREDFLVAVTAAFETLGVKSGIWEDAYPETRSLAAPHIAAFVAYIDETPAAAGMMYLSHSVAELIHIGSHPDYRRRGLGALITRLLTNEGFKRGARLASLQSSSMGEPLYRRIGYQEIGRYQWYIFPKTDS